MRKRLLLVIGSALVFTATTVMPALAKFVADPKGRV